MRKSALVSAAVMVAVLVAAGNKPPETCRATVQLTDAESGEPLAGIIQIRTQDGERLALPELFKRGTGLNDDLPIHEWSVLPNEVVVTVPAQKLTFDVLSGLETERLSRTVDLSGKAAATVRLPLVRFYRRKENRQVAGNTHLHLMKLTREDCDRYLTEIPRSDDLDVLFLSYLERVTADLEYTSNKYNTDDLAKLTRQSGVLFGNGEEHRHNFAGFGQGYGHVMFLNIRELIQPVSIGPGIMKAGSDGIPLTRGIQQARKDGATAIWCHNVFRLEAEPNWILGRLDAMNIYDGGRRAGFEERFYRLLNIGLKVPFSTGTDWFMYDFSRVYVQLDKPTTVDNWLDALAAGRSTITNGPLFRFEVDDASIGDTLAIDRPRAVSVLGQIEGRVDFVRAEVVLNGRVVASAKTRKVGNHFLAEVNQSIPIDEPGWIALRIPPPNLGDSGPKTPTNEFGRELYGHTSPVYLEVAGKSAFDPRIARSILDQMRTAQAAIGENGKFDDAQAKARVLDVYADAAARLESQHAKSDD
jgi:hypothetical protein